MNNPKELFSEIKSRKNQHIQLCLEKDVQSTITNGLEQYRLPYNALPEINFNEINLSTKFFKKNLDAPLLLSAMTGGTELGKKINKRLAKVAQKLNIAMGVGSQRAMLKDKSLTDTFYIRDVAPDILLFANFGAIQLNYGYDFNHCQELVDSIKADALVLHLNPLHEAIQPEGDTNFKNISKKIETVVQNLSVPVIIKEVGCGISGEVAHRLENLGVKTFDVAGAGGTSFPVVEGYRANLKNPKLFGQLGISTADSITQVKKATSSPSIIASGGITNGIETAKAIALGADLVGFAGAVLSSATESEKMLEQNIERIIYELKVTMFSVGATTINDLKKIMLLPYK
ncbi:type 2 isopentenyl-diphosphate Delta-isomerase [bacterium]|nr:type 2 isopentenyl-diphosphate Delta-isomerase [bacterium]